jgi:FKBP-type peptidyl-prolyl cis-trans isomerase
MKAPWVVALFAALAAITLSAQDAAPLKTEKDRASYAVGADLGNRFRQQAMDLDPALVARGIRDALAGGKTLLTDDEVKQALDTLQQEMRSKLNAKNKKEGEDYLAQNKTKEGVVTLPSGLQYKILKAGDGAKPTVDDTVVCHYRGTFINGTEFDSSYKRNQTISFPVKGVIKGWTEALQLMPVGSRWQLAIPSNLAYGERGVGPIGPDSTLLFEVELVGIQDK